MVVGDQLRFN